MATVKLRIKGEDRQVRTLTVRETIALAARANKARLEKTRRELDAANADEEKRKAALADIDMESLDVRTTFRYILSPVGILDVLGVVAAGQGVGVDDLEIATDQLHQTVYDLCNFQPVEAGEIADPRTASPSAGPTG